MIAKCAPFGTKTKKDYMNAMLLSATNSSFLKQLLKNALTDKINDREMFMKGIDYSYYYEEND
jgi:cell filamentation protein